MEKLKKWNILLIMVSFCLIFGGCARKEAEFLALAEEDGDASADGSGKEAEEDVPSGEEAAGDSASRKEDTGAEDSGDGASEEEDAAGSAAGDGGDGTSGEGSSGAVLTEPQEIYVDVCGAVASPGVYMLPAGSRVFQAIELAGGLLPRAARQSVNQASSLSDGQQIYVPTRAEVKSGISAGAADPGKSGQDPAGTGAGSGGKINLNTAGLEELMTLTGIGESKAQAILDYREEHGGFSSAEDLCQVQGIKEGTYLKIKDKIAVE